MNAERAGSGFDDLLNAKYVSLVTHRASGETVATPVWFVVRAGLGYVYTGRNAGKLKRIRRDARVQVAPCSLRGKVKGPYRSGTARVLDGPEAQAAREGFASKYGLQWRFVIRRNERNERNERERAGKEAGGASSVFIEIAPDRRAG